MPDAKTRILVVDDEECLRSTMSLALTEIGYLVRSADDGVSALREIRQECPDILLSDLHMPGMSGFELLSVVRNSFPGILVVALSGAFSGNEVPSGIPADAFYQKGSSTMALLQILTTLPRRKRSVPETDRAVTPLSIHRSGKDPSGKAEVAITCPECLRTFLQVLKGPDGSVYEVECAYCSNSIRIEDAESSNRTPQLAFRRGAGTSFSTQRTSNFSAMERHKNEPAKCSQALD